MIEDTELPASCIVRRARFTDKWTVINLMLFGVSINGNPILIATIALLYVVVLLHLSVGFVTNVLAKYENWYFYTLDVVQIGLIAWSFWQVIGIKLILFKQRNKTCLWLIESNGLVSGYGLISCYQAYSVIKFLYVVPVCRAQGLGSFLQRHNRK